MLVVYFDQLFGAACHILNIFSQYDITYTGLILVNKGKILYFGTVECAIIHITVFELCRGYLGIPERGAICERKKGDKIKLEYCEGSFQNGLI